MQKDYIMADQLVFSDGGDVTFPDAEKLEKMLNNSFSLSPQQFLLVKAIAEGQIDTTQSEITYGGNVDPVLHLLFQPGQKAKEPGRPPYRDCIQIVALDYLKRRMHRYYVRAKFEDAAALEKLLSYFRPLPFIKDLQEKLETGAQIVEIPHQNRSTFNGPRRNERPGNAPRRHDEGHYAMGERWPGSSRDGRGNRNGKGGKDRRYQSE